MSVKFTNLPDWIEEKDWIDGKDKTINLIHVHQDQVTKLPIGHSASALPANAKTPPL